MKRSHKVLFENLLQEEYNRGFNDCKKAVTRGMQIQSQETKTRSSPTPKDESRRNLAGVTEKGTRITTQALNKAKKDGLLGKISGVVATPLFK